MVTNTLDALLGVGIYTPREAAIYVGADASAVKMTRWIHGNASGEPVVRAQLEDDNERTITFLDFVQALTIRSLRHQFPNLSLQMLREGAAEAARKYGVRYPFATKHTCYVVDYPHKPSPMDKELGTRRRSKTILLIRRPGERPTDDDYVGLVGEFKDQIVIRQVFESHMKSVDFAETGERLAIRYNALRDPDSTKTVFMDPLKHFGQPMLACGFTALTLYDAYLAEGSVEAAASMYEVEPEDVQAAIAFHESLPTGAIAA